MTDESLLYKIHADVAALRAYVETELRQHTSRLDALEPRLAKVEQEMAKSRGYTLGITAAVGLLITLVNVALMLM